MATTKFYEEGLEKPIEIDITGTLLDSHIRVHKVHWSLVYKVVIGTNVNAIANDVFSNFTLLTDVTIPDSVMSIGSSTFSNCRTLTTVTIGNGVTTIGHHAFSDCGKLTTVTIPDSVETIGYGAFQKCPSLCKIILYRPYATTDIEKAVASRNFFGAPSNIEIIELEKYTTFETETDIYTSETNNGEIVIPQHVTQKNLIKLTVASDVASIGKSQFEDFVKLTNINLRYATKLTNIGMKAFKNCPGVLKKAKRVGATINNLDEIIVIPSLVNHIGKEAFQHVLIPDWEGDIYIRGIDKYKKHLEDKTQLTWLGRDNNYFIGPNTNILFRTDESVPLMVLDRNDNTIVVPSSNPFKFYPKLNTMTGTLSTSDKGQQELTRVGGKIENNTIIGDAPWHSAFSNYDSENILPFFMARGIDDIYTIPLIFTDNYDNTQIEFTLTINVRGSDDDCFPGNSKLILKDGTKKVFHDIEVGDEIQVCSKDMELSYSKVVFLPHLQNNQLTSFIKFMTESNETIRATSKHLLPVLNKNNELQNIMAEEITKEDKLYVLNNGKGVPEEIKSIERIVEEGAYTAYTKEGEYIVVDNMVGAPYAMNYNLFNLLNKIMNGLDNVGLMVLISPVVRVLEGILYGAFKGLGLMRYIEDRR